MIEYAPLTNFNMRAYRFRPLFLFNLLLLLTAFAIGCSRDEPAEVDDDEPITQPTPSPEPTVTPFPTAGAANTEPTNTPAPTPTDVPRWFEGVFVDVPAALGELEPATTISEQIEPSLPADQRFPTHDLYLLSDWPISNLIEQPRILAFPARGYASINVFAQAEIEKLKQLINEPEIIPELQTFPFLPTKSQPQAFVALGKAQPFKNGTGIRYLTWYPERLSTQESPALIYAWIGLSDDGHAVVSAIFPISVGADSLPEAPSTDSLTAFEEWAGSIGPALANLPSNAFNPPLSELDSLVSSIFAQLPEPELLFDANGKVDLTLVYPRNGGQTIIDKPLEIEGYIQPGREEQVELFLLAGNNTIAAETVVSSLDGWFRASLNVPPNIQGEMQLVAIQGGQSSEISITLVDNPIEATEPIRLQRPTDQHEAVAGFPIYFEGALNGSLVDDTLSTGILIDGCQTIVAKQELTLLPSDRYWHSVIEIPTGLSGDACAAAWTGRYGDPNWREVQIPIKILAEPTDRPEIVVGNPQTVELAAGGSNLLFGYALAPAESTLNYVVLDQDGSEIESGEADILTSGRWEIEIDLPEIIGDRIFFDLQIDGIDAYNKLFSLPTRSSES